MKTASTMPLTEFFFSTNRIGAYSRMLDIDGASMICPISVESVTSEIVACIENKNQVQIASFPVSTATARYLHGFVCNLNCVILIYTL